MNPRPDELAGTVDGFGGLTRAELVNVLADLAARAGSELDHASLTDTIDSAIQTYYLLEVDPDVADQASPDAPLLVAGPAALPQLPPGGEDLPHLLALEPRELDRELIAQEAETRLRADAAIAIDRVDRARAEQLLDACYEVEAWESVDLADAKRGLVDVLE